MSQPASAASKGQHFTTVELGSLSKLRSYEFQLGDLVIHGKAFLGAALGLTGSEISVNRMLPGEAIPFQHAHKRNEEIYLILSGRGEFEIDGERFSVSEGSAVRVAPKGERTWRNASKTEDLVFVVFQCPEAQYAPGQAGISDGFLVTKPVSW